jgi:hypothetical protein
MQARNMKLTPSTESANTPILKHYQSQPKLPTSKTIYEDMERRGNLEVRCRSASDLTPVAAFEKMVKQGAWNAHHPWHQQLPQRIK